MLDNAKLLARLMALAIVAALTACGGGEGTASAPNQNDDTPASSAEGTGAGAATQVSAANDQQAYRFLSQATFGPTAADIARVRTLGYSGWIDEQFALPLRSSHLAMVDAISATNHISNPRADYALYSWWTHAVVDPAQLRQRIAFALSQIFVVSTASGDISDSGRMVASYMDTLDAKADSNYRDLLEAVALHPAMGTYLSHRNNRKEDPKTGRVPDENFAREVMQLFSIGLYELNDDGSAKLRNGKPVETYSAADVKGLAKVFTGWSWHQPSGLASADQWKCFWRTPECRDDSQVAMPMSAYPNEHSISEKRFLGVTVPAQATPDPKASLKAALDRLANHPNTAPFISKQLIQRLVTSNPSAGYVADVTSEFRRTNGNIKAIVKAILLHPEARNPAPNTLPIYGKIREPVLRLTHLLRALPHHSRTYDAGKASNMAAYYLGGYTDDPGRQLGQTPLSAPSVFNFFRPGYKPPNTSLISQGLVAPEMQTTTEVSVLGYANFVANSLINGWGFNNSTRLMDIYFDLGTFQVLADQPSAASPQKLVTEISTRLLGGPAPQALNDRMVKTLGAMPLDRFRRVTAAILMVAVSPSFITQQ